MGSRVEDQTLSSEVLIIKHKQVSGSPVCVGGNAINAVEQPRDVRA